MQVYFTCLFCGRQREKENCLWDMMKGDSKEKRKERKKIEFEENDNHLLISIHSKLAS